MNKINSILNEVLFRVKPTKQETSEVKNLLEKFLYKIKSNLSKSGLNAEIFIGGSFAKKTLIKKGIYDVDIFIRFDKKYEDDKLSELTKKLIHNFEGIIVLHGSRDYFKIKLNDNIFVEIVPVRKTQKPSEAKNITDFSHTHVKYINKKIKNQKILDEILIAKAFCHANNCYGAESYISGFSGYALELLIIHYKSFLKFIKAMTKVKDKLIIDIEKLHKNKNVVLMDLNSSKLQSPVVLIDPTYKQRNVLAALSYETFEKFKKACLDFIKNQSINSFEYKKIDVEKIKKTAINNGSEFILIEVSTDKQPGDIAGSKLLKFYKHLAEEINTLFKIKNQGFNYDKDKAAKYFFVVRKKKEIILNGPKADDKENVLKFRKKHKNTFVKKNKIYAREKIKVNLKQFVEEWKMKNRKKLDEMHVTNLEVIDYS